MPENNSRTAFFRDKYARILTLVLILQVAGFYVISRRENVPLNRPLDQFSKQFSGWRMVQEDAVDKEILDVLRADDVMTRIYANPARNAVANLFVAYFRSQRTGQTPHSPKNCLPGAGWAPSESKIISVTVPGGAAPILVNRYIVTKGDQKSAVLYWYQTRNRVIASEYQAKIYLVADAIRYNRTDTALVRVTVPVADNQDGAATDAAVEFVQSFFAALRQFLPA
jgi:EpsI family protein